MSNKDKIDLIRKLPEYLRGRARFQVVNTKTGEVEVDEKNLARWEGTIINSPYDIFDSFGRQVCSIPDPMYIVQITDTETLEDKIKRFERGDRIGLDIRPAVYDLPTKVVGYDKRTGKPIYKETVISADLENELFEASSNRLTLAELAEKEHALAQERSAQRALEAQEAKIKAENEAKDIEEAKALLKAKREGNNSVSNGTVTPPKDGGAGGAGG